MADEHLPSPGWDAGPHDAGGGADLHAVPERRRLWCAPGVPGAKPQAAEQVCAPSGRAAKGFLRILGAAATGVSDLLT